MLLVTACASTSELGLQSVLGYWQAKGDFQVCNQSFSVDLSIQLESAGKVVSGDTILMVESAGFTGGFEGTRVGERIEGMATYFGISGFVHLEATFEPNEQTGLTASFSEVRLTECDDGTQSRGAMQLELYPTDTLSSFK